MVKMWWVSWGGQKGVEKAKVQNFFQPLSWKEISLKVKIYIHLYFTLIDAENESIPMYLFSITNLFFMRVKFAIPAEQSRSIFHKELNFKALSSPLLSWSSTLVILIYVQNSRSTYMAVKVSTQKSLKYLR